MTSGQRWVLNYVTGITVVAVAGWMWMVTSLVMECENTPVVEVPSPGGAHRAIVFERSCGATTGFSTQVSLVRGRAALPDGGGNVFVADNGDGASPEGPWGGPVVEVAWQGAEHLVVRHHPGARVFHAEPARDGVRIRYEAR